MKIKEKDLIKLMNYYLISIKKYQIKDMDDLIIKVYENAVIGFLVDNKEIESSCLYKGIGIGFKLNPDDIKLIKDKRTKVSKNCGDLICSERYPIKQISDEKRWVKAMMESLYEDAVNFNEEMDGYYD